MCPANKRMDCHAVRDILFPTSHRSSILMGPLASNSLAALRCHAEVPWAIAASKKGSEIVFFNWAMLDGFFWGKDSLAVLSGMLC
jgi:hypothetical protein